MSFRKSARETFNAPHKKIVAASTFCGVLCGIATGIVTGNPVIGIGFAAASTAINIAVNEGVHAIRRARGTARRPEKVSTDRAGASSSNRPS